MASLERQFSASLIERSKKKFSLTREGQTLYESSKEIVQMYDSLRHRLQEIQNIITGTIKLVTIGGTTKNVGGVPAVEYGGQGGLLDIAPAPDFATSKTVYLSYSQPGQGGSALAIARWLLGSSCVLSGNNWIIKPQNRAPLNLHSHAFQRAMAGPLCDINRRWPMTASTTKS